MKKEYFEIYDKDIFELKTKVVSVDKKNGFLEVVLEKTPFRPSSGGQPSDNGFLENDNFKGFVTEVLDKDSLVHRLNVEFGELKIGDDVVARINVERRKKLKIMHSGEHLFFGVLKNIIEQNNGFLEAEKINLEENEGNLFVRTQKLDFDLLFKAEEITNEFIDKGVDVVVHYANKNNLNDFLNSGLRIKTERIEEDFIRILEFKGVDVSACTGTHVKNTKEIMLFLITDFKKLGDERFVIKFKTGENARKEFVLQSKILRLIKNYVGKNDSEIFNFVKKQILDKERFKEKYYAYFSEFLQRILFDKINNFEILFLILEDEDLKLLIKNASKLCTENRIVCFLNRVGEENEKRKEDKNSEIMEENLSYDVVAMSSKEINIDLKGFFENKVIRNCPGRIGGNENYVTGRIECKNPSSIKEELIKMLENIKSHSKDEQR